MKLLVATTQRQDPDRVPPDFTGTTPGELVYLSVVCGRDEFDPDGPGACGCGRAFAGLTSGKATTTAVVADLDMTPQQLHDAVHDSRQRAGWLDLYPDEQERQESVQRLVAELHELGDHWPVGTVVRRRVDTVYEDGEVLPPYPEHVLADDDDLAALDQRDDDAE